MSDNAIIGSSDGLDSTSPAGQGGIPSLTSTYNNHQHIDSYGNPPDVSECEGNRHQSGTEPAPGKGQPKNNHPVIGERKTCSQNQ